MRATIVFEESIGKKSISKLISKIEIYLATEVDGIDLYFSSIGGEADFAYVLIDFINLNKDKIDLKLYGNIFSAGSWIAKNCKCKKEFLPEIKLMIHTANINDGTFKDINKKHNSSTWAVSESNQKTNLEFINNIKEYLLPEEINLYNNDEDVYIIDQERIKKILT
jgi:ATP-dependent protease ClpP protease subunit